MSEDKPKLVATGSGHLLSLAKYKCHKIVEAGVILAIDDAQSFLKVLNGNESTTWVKVSRDWLIREKSPHIGDYYVVYEDGYVSWSPKKAFDEGYTLIGKQKHTMFRVGHGDEGVE